MRRPLERSFNPFALCRTNGTTDVLRDGNKDSCSCEARPSVGLACCSDVIAPGRPGGGRATAGYPVSVFLSYACPVVAGYQNNNATLGILDLNRGSGPFAWLHPALAIAAPGLPAESRALADQR